MIVNGLLKPAVVDEQSEYRFYDENSLERMQEILFYRELDFSLKSHYGTSPIAAFYMVCYFILPSRISMAFST